MTLVVPPRTPRPWDPDAARTGWVLLVVGVLVSVVIHSAIPMAGSFWAVKSITQLPVTMEFESIPLPPAEELVDSPDEADVDAPDTPDDPTPDPSDKPTPDAPDTPDAADEPDAPDEPAIPDEPIVDEPPPPPSLTPVTDSDLKQRIAERDAKRAEWLAERAKRIAERNARRAAARLRAKREAQRKGGAPESGDTQGTPEPVYLCTATEKGQSLQPRTERPITSWMTIVPTVFAHFETRPNLGDYLEAMNQVYVPKKRVGLIDFAAPAQVMQLKLEQPAGMTIAVGRLDARCLIGLRYRPKLFPIQLMRLPARIIDRSNKTVSALVNITIYKDASIDVTPFDSSQPTLPLTSGRLQNSKAIARNIEDHFQAVRLANAFAELFGMKAPSSIMKDKKSPNASR